MSNVNSLTSVFVWERWPRIFQFSSIIHNPEGVSCEHIFKQPVDNVTNSKIPLLLRCLWVKIN